MNIYFLQINNLLLTRSYRFKLFETFEHVSMFNYNKHFFTFNLNVLRTIKFFVKIDYCSFKILRILLYVMLNIF